VYSTSFTNSPTFLKKSVSLETLNNVSPGPCTWLHISFFLSVPPYGAREAELETIFDVKHLKGSEHFLDTQCESNTLFLDLHFSYHHEISADRFPILLGKFISEKVYHGKLRSWSGHKIVDHSCISFIDVSKGKETKQGNSFKVSV